MRRCSRFDALNTGTIFATRQHSTVPRCHTGEFFEPALRETFYDSVDALQANLDRWQIQYNTERPHLGYHNLGNRPSDTVNAYPAVAQEAS